MIRAWSVLNSSPWAILSRTLTCWNISIRKWKKITNNQGKVRVLKRRSRNMSYVASQMFFNRDHIARMQHSLLAEMFHVFNSCNVRMYYTFFVYILWYFEYTFLYLINQLHYSNSRGSVILHFDGKSIGGWCLFPLNWCNCINAEW